MRRRPVPTTIRLTAIQTQKSAKRWDFARNIAEITHIRFVFTEDRGGINQKTYEGTLPVDILFDILYEGNTFDM